MSGSRCYRINIDWADIIVFRHRKGPVLMTRTEVERVACNRTLSLDRGQTAEIIKYEFILTHNRAA